MGGMSKSNSKSGNGGNNGNRGNNLVLTRKYPTGVEDYVTIYNVTDSQVEIYLNSGKEFTPIEVPLLEEKNGQMAPPFDKSNSNELQEIKEEISNLKDALKENTFETKRNHIIDLQRNVNCVKASTLEKRELKYAINYIDAIISEKLKIAGYEEGYSRNTPLKTMWVEIRGKYNLKESLTKMKNIYREEKGRDGIVVTNPSMESTKFCIEVMIHKITLRRLLTEIKNYTFEPNLK